MNMKKRMLVALLICGVCWVSYTVYVLQAPTDMTRVEIERRNFTGVGSTRETAMLGDIKEKMTDEVSAVGLKGADIRLPPNLKYMANDVKGDVAPSEKRKLIVIYNRPEWLYEDDRFYQKVFNACPYTCNITDDMSLLPIADALWVDLCRLQSSTPPTRLPHQMWVAFFMESPVHCWGLRGFTQWRNLFNRTFAYRTDSDFHRFYGDFQLRVEPRMKNHTDIALKKTKSIAWFVSNCNTISRREQYVNEMKKYIDIDVYGNCGTYSCPGLAEEKCFKLLNTTYFFYLSFENSFCQDYTSEKLFKTYNNLNVIPVVRGGGNYSRYLPPNTYLDAANFSSPRHLAEYMKGLIKDVDTYAGMLRTKDHFHTSFRSWIRPTLKPFCEMCKMLQMTPQPPKVYPNIADWGLTNKCWSPKDLGSWNGH